MKIHPYHMSLIQAFSYSFPKCTLSSTKNKIIFVRPLSEKEQLFLDYLLSFSEEKAYRFLSYIRNLERYSDIVYSTRTKQKYIRRVFYKATGEKINIKHYFYYL